MIEKLIEKFRRFITFGFVGIINTIIDFAVFSVSHGVLELSPQTAQVAGYLAGTVCSFVLNRNITFRDNNGNIWAQIFKFIAVNGLSLISSAWFIGVLTDAGIPAYAAKAVVTGAVMLVNYFGYKILVFTMDSGKEKEQ